MPEEEIAPISQVPVSQAPVSVPPVSVAPQSEQYEEDEDPAYECKVCHETGDNPKDFIYDDATSTTYCTEHGAQCSNCKDVGNVEDMHVHDDDWYCQTCFGELFIVCPNCEETVTKDKFYPPTRRNTYSMKHGGCEECSIKCEGCNRVVDKDNSHSNEDGQEFCEDCYSDRYTSCEECNETVANGDARHSDNGTYCESCFDEKFTPCHSCNDVIERDDATSHNDEDYCKDCYDKIAAADIKVFKEQTDNFDAFSWTKKDRVLDKVLKIVPISVRELKAKYTSLANSLGELIAFAKGQTITAELVQAYRESLGSEEFPVEYSTWTELQRSIEKLETSPVETPQLVLKIIASDQMLSELQADKIVYDMFTNINLLSRKSTHPYSEDQLGWARLELDPAKNFILVDEIQCDHSNAAFKLKNDKYGDAVKIRQALRQKYMLSDEAFDAMIDKYAGIIRNFPDIATAAVANFARANGYKKLYWHTYESGKELKGNSPPKSLYEKVPKENFFTPTEERPFDLPGQFLSREAASVQRMKIACRHIQLKQILRRYS